MASSSSSSRPAKLQRLNEMRRSVPYVSKSALAAILDDVKTNGLPELRSRDHMKEVKGWSLADWTHMGLCLRS